MSKVRVYEVAKELGMEQKALVALIQSMGFGEVRNHMSSVEPELIERVRRHIEKQKSPSVVEERIHAGVVKRRSVGRPASEVSAPQVPVSRPSVVTTSAPAPVEPVSAVEAAPPVPWAEGSDRQRPK